MPKPELTGRALAEAAAKVMGWTVEDGCPVAIDVEQPGKVLRVAWDVPDRSVASDYQCLEWARENLKEQARNRMAELLENVWLERAMMTHPHDSRMTTRLYYEPGDYARALVAAAEGGGE